MDRQECEQLFVEINNLRSSPQSYIQIVTDEYHNNCRSQKHKYKFDEFQIIINMLEIQRSKKTLLWDEDLFQELKQQVQQGIHQQTDAVNIQCMDFGHKNIRERVVSFLLYGNIKKIMDDDIQYIAIVVDHIQNEKLAIIRFSQSKTESVQQKLQRQMEEIQTQKQIEEQKKQELIEQMNRFNQSQQQQQQQQCQQQFQFIGNTKKEMNQYLKYYYDERHTDLHDQFIDQNYINTKVLINIPENLKKKNKQKKQLEHDQQHHKWTQTQIHRAETVKKNKIQKIQNYQEYCNIMKQQCDLKNLDHQEKHINRIEEKVSNYRQKLTNQKGSAQQTSLLGKKQYDKQTILNQIRYFENMERSFKDDSYQIQNDQDYFQKRTNMLKYIHPEGNKMNLKEFHELKLDHDLVRTFVKFFDNHFKILKKAKLMFESIDKLYVFMKQFFSDSNSYRLLKERKNVFEQRDNFEKLKEEVKEFLKILKIKLNESHFNLNFCLNWIEYLVEYKNYCIKIYKQQDKELGVHGCNQKVLSDFIQKAEIYYFQYTNARNLVDIEHVYDIVYQTIIERGYDVHVRNHLNEYQQIEDIQEDEEIYKVISRSIQDIYIELYKNRHENKENRENQYFYINLNDLKLIVTKIFRNKMILITKSNRKDGLVSKVKKKIVSNANNQSRKWNKSNRKENSKKVKTSEQVNIQKKVRSKGSIMNSRKMMNNFVQQQEQIIERLWDIDQKIKGKIVTGNINQAYIDQFTNQHESQGSQIQNVNDNSCSHHLDRLIGSANEYDELQIVHNSHQYQNNQQQQYDDYDYSQCYLNDNQQEYDYQQQQEYDYQQQQEYGYQQQQYYDQLQQQEQYQDNPISYIDDHSNSHIQDLSYKFEQHTNHGQSDNTYDLSENHDNFLEEHNINEYEHYDQDEEKVTFSPIKEMRQSELAISQYNESINRLKLPQLVQQFRSDQKIYYYLMQVLRTDSIIERILQFIMPCQNIFILNKEILQTVVYSKKISLKHQAIILAKKKKNLEIMLLLEQNKKVINQETGKEVDLYQIVEQTENKVNVEQQIGQDSIFDMKFSEQDLVLIQQDSTLSKVIILCYILNEQYDNLQMNNETNEFMFTKTQYFLDNTIGEILNEFNRKSELNQQKVTLIGLLFNKEQFEELKDKDILASAISPAFYFLDLFVQCFISMIGVGFDGQIEWFQEGLKSKGLLIQQKLEQEGRFVDEQVEIYNRLNRYFVLIQ